MSQHGTFATALNCMDGRAIPAVIEWLKREHAFDYVDTISEPGMDNYLLQMLGEQEAWLRHKLEISIARHGSRLVAVAGHHDCAGNPVSKDEHIAHIRNSVLRLQSIIRSITDKEVEIIGLWVFPYPDRAHWSVERVAP